MFIQIRGTFGSGKSTTAHGLQDALAAQGWIDGPVVFYEHHFAQCFSREDLSAFIYFMGRGRAGADANSWKGAMEQIEQFIRDRAPAHAVVMEGSIVSSMKFVRMAADLQGQGVKCQFFDMNTDLEECIRRVEGRRLRRFESGLTKLPPKPVKRKGVEGLYKAVERIHTKTVEAGLPCSWISTSPESTELILEHIMEAVHGTAA